MLYACSTLKSRWQLNDIRSGLTVDASLALFHPNAIINHTPGHTGLQNESNFSTALHIMYKCQTKMYHEYGPFPGCWSCPTQILFNTRAACWAYELHIKVGMLLSNGNFQCKKPSWFIFYLDFFNTRECLWLKCILIILSIDSVQ